MVSYYLPPHVRVCITTEGVVFLDLKRDRYLGLGALHAEALARLLRPDPSPELVSHTTAGANDDLGTALVSRELLTTDALLGHRMTASSLPVAEGMLVDPVSLARLRIAPAHVVRFALACAAAHLLVRRRTLVQIVARLSARRRNPQSASFDMEVARHLLSVFFRLRALAYTKKGQCLLDSLVLTEFLSRFAIHPTLVLGVKMRPFAAHSWIQHGGCVFNATPEYVRLFTPILTV